MVFEYHKGLNSILLAKGLEAINYSFIDNLIFGFWKFLPLLIVSYGVGLSVEFAFAISRNHSVNGVFSYRHVNSIDYAC